MEKPIVYEKSMVSRFSDLDMYGHVNAKHYLDFVATSRLQFLQEDMNISVNEVKKKGYLWFLGHSEVKYMQPITGIAHFHCRSWVKDTDRSKLFIDFELLSHDRKQLHASGQLIYLIISTENHKTTDCPDWMKDLFFERQEPKSSKSLV